MKEIINQWQFYFLIGSILMINFGILNPGFKKRKYRIFGRAMLLLGVVMLCLMCLFYFDLFVKIILK